MMHETGMGKRTERNNTKKRDDALRSLGLEARKNHDHGHG